MQHDNDNYGDGQEALDSYIEGDVAVDEAFDLAESNLTVIDDLDDISGEEEPTDGNDEWKRGYNAGFNDASDKSAEEVERLTSNANNAAKNAIENYGRGRESGYEQGRQDGIWEATPDPLWKYGTLLAVLVIGMTIGQALSLQ